MLSYLQRDRGRSEEVRAQPDENGSGIAFGLRSI